MYVLQPGFLRDPSVDLRLPDFQDLGLEERDLLAKPRADLLHLLLHALVLGDARVLVREEARVEEYPLQFLRDAVDGVERVREARGDVPSVPLNGAIVAICGFSLSLASRHALSDA